MYWQQISTVTTLSLCLVGVRRFAAFMIPQGFCCLTTSRYPKNSFAGCRDALILLLATLWCPPGSHDKLVNGDKVIFCECFDIIILEFSVAGSHNFHFIDS